MNACLLLAVEQVMIGVTGMVGDRAADGHG